MDQIIHVLSEGGRTEQPVVESLKSVFFIRELCKLRDFHDHVTCSLGLLLHKRFVSFKKKYQFYTLSGYLFILNIIILFDVLMGL